MTKRMKRVREGGLITFIGFVVFVLGTGNYFQNETLQGLFLTAGLFIMIPLGTIITFYFFLHVPKRTRPQGSPGGSEQEAARAGQMLVVWMFVPLLLSFIPIIFILPALGISGAPAGAIFSVYILVYFIIQFYLLKRRNRFRKQERKP